MELKQGDCLELMKDIPNESVDLILCDLPYGQTQNKWDVVIPLDKLWEQYIRILKDKGIIVLTSNQPFTTDLINSNRNWFKYDLIWDKISSSGFLNANRMPLRTHEHILIFYKKLGTYNPQKFIGKERTKGGKKYKNNGNYGYYNETQKVKYNKYYPTSIIAFTNAKQKGKVHPTQKSLDLFKWLINTYSNKGDTVLDNCMGSGTTGIACVELERDFIGFELNDEYFKVAEKRINEIQKQVML